MRYFGYNSYRLITSFLMFAGVIACMIWAPHLPFSLPRWVYILLTVYYAVFPISDMLPSKRKTLYKSKQFAEAYEENPELDRQQFLKAKKRYDRGAAASMVFWLSFLAVVGVLKGVGILSDIWILFFAAMSDFCVYFAIFFWCPFHKIFIRPKCCMDCRIFNWDSFFSFSFLIFLPSVYTAVLVGLSLCSLVQWEIRYHRHPERFYVQSNRHLSCENCDMEHCKNRKPLHAKAQSPLIQTEPVREETEAPILKK